VIGLSAALEWLEETDIAQAENWSRGLATLAEEELAKRPGFRSFRCQEPACWPLILTAFITAIW
jgi:cysteine sulfinate desulfinase